MFQHLNFFIYSFLAFGLSIQAQKIPTLKCIRENYFILNDGNDSLEMKGLKNPSTQMIYLVFAAEEDPIGLDPGLSSDGRWRSIHLNQILKDQDIAACISTPFRRNVLTLQVLAEQLHLPINYYDQSDIQSLCTIITQYKSKEVVLMVHKATFAKIIENFTKKPFTETIPDNVSDRIFVLERPLKGASTLQEFRYDIR